MSIFVVYVVVMFVLTCIGMSLEKTRHDEDEQEKIKIKKKKN